MVFMVHICCLFQKIVPVRISDVVRCVKVLDLLTTPNLDLVTGFLKCFPCVERLYIVVRVYSCQAPLRIYFFCFCCTVLSQILLDRSNMYLFYATHSPSAVIWSDWY